MSLRVWLAAVRKKSAENAVGRAARWTVEALESRLMLNAVTWTGAGDGVNWTNPNNWSTKALPGPTDDVTISSAVNPVQISSGTQSVNSLTTSDPLIINGGTLSLAAASTSSSTVTLSGGALTGAGNLKVSGTLNWSAGTMSGTGTTIIAAGATMTISQSEGALGRVLENDGTVNWSGLNTLNFANGTINNYGTLTASPASTGMLQAGGTASGQTDVFNNEVGGTFIQAGLGQTIFLAPFNWTGVIFNNAGSVSVQGGNVSLTSGGTHTGSFSVASGATFDISGSNSFSSTSTIGGAGAVSITGGTSSFAGQMNIAEPLSISGTANFNANSTLGSLSLSGGTLGGTGTVTLDGPVSCSNGTIDATKTIVAPGETMTISGLTLGHVLENDGTVNWTAGGLALGNGTINNYGTWTASPAGTANLQTTDLSAGETNVFNNEVGGAFVQAGQGQTTFTSYYSPASMTFNNAGLVSVQAGTLGLTEGGTHAGSFSVASGATFDISGSNSFLSTSTISGAGAVSITGGTSSFAGQMNIAEPLSISGTANFNANSTLGSLSLSGGTLGGTGTVTLDGPVSCSNGTIDATKTIVAPGETMTISGLTLGHVLENDGTVNWTAGGLALGNGTINNYGTWTASPAGTANLQTTDLSAGETNVFNNEVGGAFVQAGQGQTTFTSYYSPASMTFNNAGLVSVQAGTLGLTEGGTHAGSFSVASGATFDISGSNSFLSTSTISGAGAVSITGGTSSFAGQMNIAEPLSISGTANFNANSTLGSLSLGGTLGGTGVVTLDGPVSCSNGTIDATKTIVAPGETMTISGLTLGHVLENDGTVNWTAGGLALGNGTINNYGTWTASPAGTANLQTTDLSAGETNVFNNEVGGTFVQAGQGQTTFTSYYSPKGVVFNNSGSVSVEAGTLSINSALFVGASGYLGTSLAATLVLNGGAITGASTNASLYSAIGDLQLNGPGSAASPELLEAMSDDLGSSSTGYSNNFAYGTIALNNGAYVKLVDQAKNSSASTGPEAVYVNTLTVPSGTTLDLNGLHLYARESQVGGTILNGSISALPTGGPTLNNVPVPGDIKTPGQIDDWTFFGRAGSTVIIVANPGIGAPAPALTPPVGWAQVQLLDANNNVIAQSDNTASASGALVTLAGVQLPADGLYQVIFRAPPSKGAATGYYTLVVYNASVEQYTLNLNDLSVGSIASPYDVDHWTFAASAGQLVQFHLVSEDNAAIAFTLSGPNGYTGFNDANSDSAPLELPAAGVYTLSVQTTTGQTGAYAFRLFDSTVVNLAPNSPYNGSLVASGQGALFEVSLPIAQVLSVQLADPATADDDQLYVKYGSAPTPSVFDYDFSSPGNHPNVIVPGAAAGIWWMLVYGQNVPATTTYTLTAAASPLQVTGSTPSVVGSSVPVTMTITGAGFAPGTTVSLVASDGITTYAPSAQSIDLFTQISATFPANIPVGTYSLKATNVGGSATLAGAITIEAAGQANLVTHLASPSVLGRHEPAVLYIEYANTGNAPMPAPLIELESADLTGSEKPLLTLNPALENQGLFTSALPNGFSNSITILASGATPGILNPGESESIPVYYAGLQQPWPSSATIPLGLSVVQASDSRPMNWYGMTYAIFPPVGGPALAISTAGSKNIAAQIAGGSAYTGTSYSAEGADGDFPWVNGTPPTDAQIGYPTQRYDEPGFLQLQPAGFTSQAWQTIVNIMAAQVGYTLGNWVTSLDNNATYLDRLGLNDSNVNDLMGLEVLQAGGLATTGPLATATDASLPAPGMDLTFTRSFTDTIPGRDGVGLFGQGWDTPCDVQLQTASDGSVTLSNTTGILSRFTPDTRSTGTYFSPQGDTSQLVGLGNGIFQLDDPNGDVTQFLADGKLNYIEDTDGNKITAGYNASEQLISLTHSSGQSLAIGYNAAGLISSVTDSDGRVTTYTYDANSQYLLSVTTPQGTTNYTYDTSSGANALNALTSIQFPDLTHAYFTYDSFGRLASTSADNNAGLVNYTYDPNNVGEVTATDADNDSSSVFFNQFGLVAKTQDALGNNTSYAYDPNTFFLTQVTDPLGQTASFAYDGTGNLLTATDQSHHTTTFTYGLLSRLTSATDANGDTTSYAYDADGNLLGTTYADQSSSQGTFDPEGDPSSFVNQRGQAIGYTYNANGQILQETFPDNSHLTYTYDSHGNLKTAADSTGTTTFTYNAADELTRVAYPGGKFIQFTLDAAGRRMQMADQTGFIVNYSYNAAGQLSGLSDVNNNPIVTYVYDAAGRLSQKNNGNGTYTTYAYDANGNVLHVINYAPGGTTINSRFDYTYDSLNRCLTMATLNGIWTYSYDPTGELTAAVFASTNPAIPSQSLTYNYDAVGNRTGTVINGVTTNYTTNKLNEYTSVGGVTQLYDADGNLVYDGTNTYTYDFLDRLISVTGPSGTTTYTYDSLGHRSSSTTNGQTTQYLNDPTGLTNVIAELDGNGNVVANNAYGLGLTSQTTGGGTFYYDYDALGNTAGLTNASGSYVDQYSYLPFGGNLASIGTVPNQFQFSGQLGASLAGSGLYFIRNRYLSLPLGEFISTDPLGLLGGDVNTRRYVMNSPTNAVDPSGLFPSGLPGAAAGAGIGLAGAGAIVVIGYGVGIAAGIVSLPVTLTASGIISVASGIIYEVVVFYGTHQQEINDLIEDLSGWIDGMGDGLPSKTLFFQVTDIADNHDTLFQNIQSVNNDLNRLLDGTLQCIQLPPIYIVSPDIATSIDPNAISGSVGYGSVSYITPNTTIPYRITFENIGPGSVDANGNPYLTYATAPAQRVTISDQLSSNLDWTTFRLGEMGFGNTVIQLPSDSQTYSGTVTVTIGGNTFDVQLSAGINLLTGLVSVVFQSIDPATSLPPQVLIGFLPPEDGTGRGKGYFTYTIQPKASLPTGTRIQAVALISFDEQTEIATDQVNDQDPTQGIDPTKEALNTIDAGPPTSSVSALAATQTTTSFTLNWSGQDDAGGSGIASYSVYYSVNGGAYQALLTDTTLTSLGVTGTPGDTYGFYSVATDNVGNVQPTPGAAQATTFVSLVTPITVTNMQVNGDNPNGLFNAPGQPTAGAQRSMVEDIVYTFSAPVTISDANSAFTVVGTGQFAGVAPTSLSAEPVLGSNGTQWAVTLTGQAPGVLASIANGTYSITVNPSFIFAASDGVTPISAGRADSFFRLFGDITGDGRVNNADLAWLKKAFAPAGGIYNPAFDYFDTGIISNADLTPFKNDFLLDYFG